MRSTTYLFRLSYFLMDGTSFIDYPKEGQKKQRRPSGEPEKKRKDFKTSEDFMTRWIL